MILVIHSASPASGLGRSNVLLRGGAEGSIVVDLLIVRKKARWVPSMFQQIRVHVTFYLVSELDTAVDIT